MGGAQSYQSGRNVEVNMSRTPLGYFELPLTQEERDMIVVPFLGYKNKIEQFKKNGRTKRTEDS